MAGSARFGVTVDGFDEAIARLSALPKEANKSIRAASKRIAADEAPCVSTSRFTAFIVPPPVVWIPPELRSVVRIVESEMLTVVPLP